jgi:hypothetical protein
VLAATDYLEAAAPVVRVVSDLVLPELADDRPVAPRDPERLIALAERWGLDSALNRLLAALRAA